MVFLNLACNQFTENNVKYVIKSDSVFSFTSNFTLKFKAKQVYTIDTININWKNNDTVRISTDYVLYMDSSLTITQIENFLPTIGIHTNKLREHLYWMNLLSNSKILPVKNSFNDLEGYNISSPSGEKIPDLYYDLENRGNRVILRPYFVKLGELKMSNTNNIIEVGLCKSSVPEKTKMSENKTHEITFDPNVPYTEWNYYFIPEDRSNPTGYCITPIRFKNGDIPKFSIKNFSFSLFIRVKGELCFQKKTYVLYPDYSPYNLQKLDPL